jgi:hypothetical protein
VGAAACAADEEGTDPLQPTPEARISPPTSRGFFGVEPRVLRC